MSKIIKNTYALLSVLLVLGLATRFAFIWHPAQVVFDEVHFGKFVSGYFTGEYFFDIHPPLGKLLIALPAYLSGFQPVFDFKVIGEVYSSNAYITLRFIPNLFGALLPLCIFCLVRSLNGSKLAALFAGITLVFENAILVQSHFIFVDSMLLFFGFLGLSLFFWYRNRSKKPVYLIFAGVSLGCAFSIKWTGLSFLGLAGLVSLWDIVRQTREKGFPTKEFLICGLTLTVLPLVVYVSVFAVHFSLLTKSGPGDAFMSPGFLKTLEGSSKSRDAEVDPHNFLEKFVELNGRILSSNTGLSATHSDSSRFYTWPLMHRPIYYWFGTKSTELRSRIYLVGNPVVWWTAFLSMIAALFFWKPESSEKKWFLYLGWGMNIVPFMFIKRVMFLYHYFPALIFSVVIMSLFFFDSSIIPRKYRTGLFIVSLLLFALTFIFFSPLSYGFPLSREQYHLRFWFSAWE